MDGMLITVLPDGTLKIETDKISAANHASAEAFLRDANSMMGGEVTKKRKGGLLGYAGIGTYKSLGNELKH